MKKEFENYEKLQFTLEELRDNMEVVIRDCEQSAEKEEARIRDDAREARFYAEFLEQMMKRNPLIEGDKETLKFAVSWLYSIVKRKEELT